MAARNAHTSDQKAFIVRRLAAFETPKDIAVAFAARFPDTACNEDDVRATDPRLAVVAPDLYLEFTAARERILLDPTAAPFAEQRARLIVLSRQAERYENNNQPAEARAVFRQIAEELGVVAGGKGGKAAALGKSDENATPEFKAVKVTRTVVHPPTEASPV